MNSDDTIAKKNCGSTVSAQQSFISKCCPSAKTASMARENRSNISSKCASSHKTRC
ncbi:hypothetical protein [Microcoleus sp. FACHB-1515]|uniref:hypothetical protein n=1 Tax=Microcoleus sp. FACHB-1515 TaxID=2692821 RepID=UPI0037C84207